MFIEMWMIFIDPFNHGYVDVSDTRTLFGKVLRIIYLEELARGKYTYEPTLISSGFSNAMTYALQVHSDLESDIINMTKIK